MAPAFVGTAAVNAGSGSGFDLRGYLSELPKAVVLDVRGTMLDPYRDVQAEPFLLATLSEMLRRGTTVALISGCSRLTIERLILQHWRRLNLGFFTPEQPLPGHLYIYTETGSKAFIAQRNLSLQALSDYVDLRWRPSTQKVIQRVLERVNREGGHHADIQGRSSQFNFYVEKGNRAERQGIAERIETALAEAGVDIPVHVPSAKPVIDIALSSKARAVQDFKLRVGVPDMRQWLVISDSLQRDGADVGLLESLPGCKAVHVGLLDAALHSETIHVGGGPQATQRVLVSALSQDRIFGRNGSQGGQDVGLHLGSVSDGQDGSSGGVGFELRLEVHPHLHDPTSTPERARQNSDQPPAVCRNGAPGRLLLR